MRSRMPSLSTSSSTTTPRMALPEATTSGVAPLPPIILSMASSPGGTVPPSLPTWARTASGAPLRSTLPSGRSMPLMRLCAEKGTMMVPWGGALALRPRAAVTMLLPSGVWSPAEASAASRCSSASEQVATGRNWVARRLPTVMVPVLSSTTVSISPATSTALPLLAMILARIARSMPAMPMAASRAPMVVGIRHTSRATRVGISVPRLLSGVASPRYDVMYCSAFRAIGHSGTTTIRKIRVKADRTSVSAISFGVRCRTAPSTRRIMWSMKVSPARAVMRMVISSEITMVPPVTPVRSPPNSRITGADSPVMADSSTAAAPSTTSPSLGMICQALTITRSPGTSLVDLTVSTRSPCSR